MTRQELQTALDLANRTSFRERYLEPALDDGLIEMTALTGLTPGRSAGPPPGPPDTAPR